MYHILASPNPNKVVLNEGVDAIDGLALVRPQFPRASRIYRQRMSTVR